MRDDAIAGKLRALRYALPDGCVVAFRLNRKGVSLYAIYLDDWHDAMDEPAMKGKRFVHLRSDAGKRVDYLG